MIESWKAGHLADLYDLAALCVSGSLMLFFEFRRPAVAGNSQLLLQLARAQL